MQRASEDLRRPRQPEVRSHSAREKSYQGILKRMMGTKTPRVGRSAVAGLAVGILAIGSVALKAWSAEPGPSGPVWDIPQELTGSGFESEVWFNWGRSIAADDAGYVHMVYLENISGSSPTSLGEGRIHYLRSTDEGATWPVHLSLTGPDAMIVGRPKVAAFDARVYVAFQIVIDLATPPTYPPSQPHATIAMVISDDRGLSWRAPFSVSANPVGSVAAAPPSVFARGPFVHVAWNDDRTQGAQEVYVRSSRNHGNTWTGPMLVSNDDGKPSWTPGVALWGDHIYVAWTDEQNHEPACTSGTTCKEELYFRRSLNFGVDWDPEQRLTEDPKTMEASTWAPSIDAWEDQASGEIFVHVAYFDQKTPTGDFGIYYRRSEDGGVSWSDEVLLSDYNDPDPPRISYRPVIATFGGDQVHAVWAAGDGNEGSSGASDVYYRRWEKQGRTWGAIENLTARTASTASQPSIAVAPSQKVHVQWHDDLSGVNRIYYQRTLLP